MIWGVLTDGVWNYRLTDRDVHWLTMSLWGETGRPTREDLQAVTWTMAQRFYMLRNRRFSDRSGPDFDPGEATFADLVRAYSQPVNAWHRTHCPTRAVCDRRKDYQSSPFGDAPAEVRDYARRWALGLEPATSNLRGLVHFIGTGMDPNPGSLGPRSLPNVSGNKFYWTSETARWRSVPIRVVPPAVDVIGILSHTT